MSLQEDRLAGLVLADRLLVEVDVDAAGQRVGHHQRRRHQVVGAHVGVDAPLEVAVARQHRADHQVALLDGLGDGRRQRPELPMQVVQP
jgi:hypothetical protein